MNVIISAALRKIFIKRIS